MEWSEATRTAMLAGMVLASVYTDLSSGKIYNKVVLPFIPIGLAVWTVSGGWEGFIYGLAGTGVGAIALVIAGGPRWLAAGDAKLLTAIGALMGPGFVGSTMMFAGIVGGLIALIMIGRRRLLKQWARGSVVAWATHLPISTCWTERAGFMPYSIPIAIGCVLAGVFPILP